MSAVYSMLSPSVSSNRPSIINGFHLPNLFRAGPQCTNNPMMMMMMMKSGMLNTPAPPLPVNPIVQPTCNGTVAEEHIDNIFTNSQLNFTAHLLKILSSNPQLDVHYLESLCGPLIQTIVKSVLTECMPHFDQLKIQGQLELCFTCKSMADMSKILVAFDDVEKEKTPVVAPQSPLQPPLLVPLLPTLSTTATTTTRPEHVKSDMCHSRRKSQNPSKFCLAEDMTTGTSLYASSHSSPTSPSTTDSGVLDLSRSGSLAGSAPITPMKNLNLFGDNDINVENYQKQWMLFHHLWKANHMPQTTATNNFCAPTSTWKPSINYSLEGNSSPLDQLNSSPNKSIRRKSKTVSPMFGLKTSKSSRRFPCNQCREEFPSLHTLEEHTLYRHGTYRCHICNAQFTQRSNLQRHALKHVGFKPFECKVCAKAYYRKDHLMRHMEMGHPGFAARENITVHLTSSESLDYLNRSNNYQVESIEQQQQDQQQQQHQQEEEEEDKPMQEDVINQFHIDNAIQGFSNESSIDEVSDETDHHQQLAPNSSGSSIPTDDVLVTNNAFVTTNDTLALANMLS